MAGWDCQERKPDEIPDRVGFGQKWIVFWIVRAPRGDNDFQFGMFRLALRQEIAARVVAAKMDIAEQKVDLFLVKDLQGI